MTYQTKSNLSKISNVFHNDAVKKVMHDKSVTKVNAINSSGFILKTKYGTAKSDLEKKINDADKKIPDITDFVKKTDYNAKITEKEFGIPSTAGLATSIASTAAK